jgi:hypothetical protein
LIDRKWVNNRDNLIERNRVAIVELYPSQASRYWGCNNESVVCARFTFLVDGYL